LKQVLLFARELHEGDINIESAHSTCAELSEKNFAQHVVVIEIDEAA
jgi:hypothetical protein